MPTILPRSGFNFDFTKAAFASGDNYATEGAKLDELITFSRASAATRINASGLVQSLAAGQPRFGFDQNTLSVNGLLIEEQRTNLLLQSAAVGMTSWNRGDLAAASGYAAPDGSTTAVRLLETAGTVAPVVNQAATVPVATTSFSIWFKTAGRNLVQMFLYDTVAGTAFANSIFNVSTGVLSSNTSGSYRAVGYPGGWVRYTVTGLPANAAVAAYFYVLDDAGNLSHAGDITKGVYAWGAQVESGLAETSYIPTTTTAATRAADRAEITSLKPWFNPLEGTWIGDYLVPASIATDAGLVHASDNTFNNRMGLSIYSALSLADFVAGGTTVAAYASPAGAIGVSRRVASSYRVNDFSMVADGGVVAVDSAGAVPTVTRIDLGSFHTGGGALNGWLRRLQYIPFKVSDLQLKQLTRP